MKTRSRSRNENGFAEKANRHGHFMVPHCPEEEQRWKRRRNGRRKCEGQDRADTLYFRLILLKADRISRFHSSRGQFSIRHCTPKVSIRDGSRFHQIRNLTWSNDSFFFFFSLRPSVSSFMFSFSLPPLLSTIFDSTRYWDAVICPQFDHKWSQPWEYLLECTVKAVFLLFLFPLLILLSILFFFLFLFLLLLALLFFSFFFSFFSNDEIYRRRFKRQQPRPSSVEIWKIFRFSGYRVTDIVRNKNRSMRNVNDGTRTSSSTCHSARL